jgi:hypothetical protein
MKSSVYGREIESRKERERKQRSRYSSIKAV